MVCKCIGNKILDDGICETCDHVDDLVCPLNKVDNAFVNESVSHCISDQVSEFKDGKYIHTVTLELDEETLKKLLDEQS